MAKFSRRDFIKFGSVLTAGTLAQSFLHFLGSETERPNIIVLLFDALSAKHMSLYGYPRETTPRMSKFAERATVYHNHYSAGNFTTPGTASLLTGMLPWKHRAYTQGGLVKRNLISNNIFSLLGNDYYRLAFSQNPWPDRLVGQFHNDVDRFLPSTTYSLRGNKLVSDKLSNDRSLAATAFEDFLFTLNTDIVGSSLLGFLYKNLALDAILKTRDHPWYPRGVPEVEGFTTYINENIFAGVFRELQSLADRREPYFSYFHLFSPHFPYKPGRKYWKLFVDDGFQPLQKPVHPLGFGMSEDDLLSKRNLYDQQIAHVDAEFGNLIDKLDAEGLLENSYVVVTSDHGEIFERGFYGHGGVILYEPAINIPLLISSPEQSARHDVYSPSCNTDLLPSLLGIGNKEIPSVVDGELLPGFNREETNDRPIFSIYAAENSVFLPLKKFALSMRRGSYKLIAYFGYPGYDDVYELYDLENDPEELQNLTKDRPGIFSLMKEELLENLSSANKPYEDL